MDIEDRSSAEMDLDNTPTPSPGSREALPTPLLPPLPAAVTSNLVTKRKLTQSPDTNGVVAGFPLKDTTKRLKISASSDRLPIAIWQQVFLHLSPAMLSRCLCVCKTFNHALTQTVARAPRNGSDCLSPMDSEHIWTVSRRTHTKLLRPLRDLTELRMLQLLGGRDCEGCHKHLLPVTATSPYNAGPGTDGVRVIWPFAIRLCGHCLELRIIKDIDVLTDNSLAPLRLGVPHGFRTLDLHFVPDAVRAVSGALPAHVRLAKIYGKQDLASIKAEYEFAKGLGKGAAEEWRKGLSKKGKQAMADSARWEEWELKVGLGSNLAHVLKGYDPASFPRHVNEAQSRSAGVSILQPPPDGNGLHPLPQRLHLPNISHGPSIFPTPPFHQLPKPIRKPHEVEEIRQARKAEIERRCSELEPPLDPSILPHMESFRAAMQIITPMTDAGWELLKPRILAQREEAELSEHHRAQQAAFLQAATPITTSDAYSTRLIRDTHDRVYEKMQEPLRRRLGMYATECIATRYKGGELVDHANAPVFAANVLLHVQQCYEDAKRTGQLPVPTTAAKQIAQQLSPPVDPPFLSVDNMKWVHETKIRRVTDAFRRELFLCAVCSDEMPKWFSFEGLVQHYGAKHTTAFSAGNVVVHWRTAPWPSEEVFKRNPCPQTRSDYRPSRGNKAPHGRYFDHHTGNHQGPPTHVDEDHHTGLSADLYGVTTPSQTTQTDKLSDDARAAWDLLTGVEGLLGCVRMQAALHHAVDRFIETFQTPPDLQLFTIALTSASMMKPLKSARDLHCRRCVREQNSEPTHSRDYYVRVRMAPFYSLQQLITHWQLMHLPQGHGHAIPVETLIEVPYPEKMKPLLHAPGMTDEKLATIASAFPVAFPLPLPSIGSIEAPSTSKRAEDGSFADRVMSKVTAKYKQPPAKKKKKIAQRAISPNTSSTDWHLEPTEDEYDPRRPMFVQTDKDQLSVDRYDTDMIRKPSTPSFSTPGGVQYTHDQRIGPQLSDRSSDSRDSRSPSVGRPRADLSLITKSDSNATESVQQDIDTTEQPDFASILQQLERQIQPLQAMAGPTALHDHNGDEIGEVHNRSRRASETEPPRLDEDNRRSGVSRNGPAHRTGRDTHAFRDSHENYSALPSNHLRAEHDRQETSVEAGHFIQAQAPPQHRQVYRPQHRETANIYHESPIQYIQLPGPVEHSAFGYHREYPAQRRIYIDEHGRQMQLIPLDLVPTPTTRYLPEHSQHGYQYDASPAPVQPASRVHPQPQQYRSHRPTPALSCYASHLSEQPQPYIFRDSVPAPSGYSAHVYQELQPQVLHEPNSGMNHHALRAYGQAPQPLHYSDRPSPIAYPAMVSHTPSHQPTYDDRTSNHYERYPEYVPQRHGHDEARDSVPRP